MKKKYLLVYILVFIITLTYAYYSYFFKKIDYNFDNVLITKEDVTGKGKEFKREIENIGLSSSIIKWDKTGVQLRLSKYELRKVLNSNKTKQYIGNYQTLEDLKRLPNVKPEQGNI